MRISFPRGDEARWVDERRDWRRVREVERLRAMELRPEISSSRALSS